MRLSRSSSSSTQRRIAPKYRPTSQPASDSTPTPSTAQPPSRSGPSSFSSQWTAAIPRTISFAERGQEKTTMESTPPITAQADTKGAPVRRFKVDIPQAKIDDMRRRVAETQWPEKETVGDLSQGVPLDLMQEVA